MIKSEIPIAEAASVETMVLRTLHALYAAGEEEGEGAAAPALLCANHFPGVTSAVDMLAAQTRCVF